MRARVSLSSCLAVLTLSLSALADPPGSHGEITLAYERPRGRGPELVLSGGVGVLSHATTGTAPRDGYDSASAPSLGGTARLLFPLPACRCLSHGVELNYAWASGPSFGISHGAAFTQHLADASYAVRTELPCLRSGDRRWWVSATLGLSVRVANAGTGDRALDDLDDANARGGLSARYDHTAMGWRLGGAMDVTFGRFLVGVAVEMRDLYGIDTELRRTTMMGAALRVGADFLL